MANLLIGDIHGCYHTFMKLLKKVDFSSDDTLWLSGDLVARGEDSLSVLRFVYQHRDQVKLVLGNHDLHLIALHSKISKKKAEKDNLQDLLNAPDCDVLVDWLRRQPFLQMDSELKIMLTHAGFYPWWDLKTLKQCADELHQMLSSDAYPFFIDKMYGDHPNKWSNDLVGFERLRFIANALTRMRFCDEQGHLDLQKKGKPDSGEDNYVKPWFDFPRMIPDDYQLFFGHWAALEGQFTPKSIYALDTGCCWGDKLSCYRFETQQFIRKKYKNIKID